MAPKRESRSSTTAKAADSELDNSDVTVTSAVIKPLKVVKVEHVSSNQEPQDMDTKSDSREEDIQEVHRKSDKQSGE